MYFNVDFNAGYDASIVVLGFIPDFPVVALHLPVAPPFVHVTRAYLLILTLPLLGELRLQL